MTKGREMSFGHKHGGAAATATVKSNKGGTYISLAALTMMNVTVVAGLANDVQQSFYGLSSVTYFTLGALLFFLPTGLVAAELAGGWNERGGIFRWVGEGIGPAWAFVCIFLLWFQTTFNFGVGVASFSATIGFFTPDYDWAVSFAQHPTNELLIMCCWLGFYWVLCFLATKGVKVFAPLTKYGVLVGTFIPLATIIVLFFVYVGQGHPIEFMQDPATNTLIPKWEGMSTLALAAGVFFSFAGIDMNAAHIKEIKNPRKTYPLSIIISMVLALVIFMVGTLIIAAVVPNKDINVLYTLYDTYRTLGATIGIPWLYMIFVYAGLGATIANLVTNLAGPSVMLGNAGRSGFLPKFLQNENKAGMPSRLMYFQLAGMTIIAFVVFLLPNIEGFVVLITQAITILYMLYYVLMFIAFIRLKYTQPNRPRSFVVPGGKVGAWIVAGVGTAASVFGIVLALYPPAQVASEVGSGTTYVTIIIVLTVLVLAISFGIYFLSRKRDWVDPQNKMSPFTWEIEGLKKPGKVTSNVPSDILAQGQDPMGLPIKRHWSPDEHIDLTKVAGYEPSGGGKHRFGHHGDDQPVAPPQPAAETGIHAVAAANANYVAPATAVAATPVPEPAEETVHAVAEGVQRAAGAAAKPSGEPPEVEVPKATAAEVAAAELPDDPAQAAKAASEEAERLAVAAAALEREAEADRALSDARERAKAAVAAARDAERAVGLVEDDADAKADAPKAAKPDAPVAPATDAAEPEKPGTGTEGEAPSDPAKS